MTRKEIEKLVELIPADAPYLHHLPPSCRMSESVAQSCRASEVGLYADALHDPAIGWKFVRTFIELGRTFPRCLNGPRHEALLIAWVYETTTHRDPAMRQVLAWTLPAYRSYRDAIRAHMVCPDMDYKETAIRLHTTEKAIWLYEQLFFNVRDRLDEIMFINGLLHPDSRTVELHSNYMLKESPGDLMLRAAVDHDIDAAMDLAGMAPKSRPEATNSAKSMENLTMHAAVRWIKSGGINQRIPSISAGRGILQSSKMGGQESEGGGDGIGGTFMDMSMNSAFALQETCLELEHADNINGRPMTPKEKSAFLIGQMNDTVTKALAAMK